jgi:hypothetical protein
MRARQVIGALFLSLMLGLAAVAGMSALVSEAPAQALDQLKDCAKKGGTC